MHHNIDRNIANAHWQHASTERPAAPPPQQQKTTYMSLHSSDATTDKTKQSNDVNAHTTHSKHTKHNNNKHKFNYVQTHAHAIYAHAIYARMC